MKKYLCIDVGGTAIKFGLYDSEGKLLQEIPSVASLNADGSSKIVTSVLEKITALQENTKLTGICICTAGVVDPDTGCVVYAGYTIPNYTNTQWKIIIEQHTGVPCEVENDVNAACLGEMWQGELQHVQSGVCLTVGTGIGGAVLLNGEIYHGTGFTAGEVGYMRTAGMKFQDAASTTALLRRLKERGCKAETGHEVFALAKAGDPLCLEEINRMVDYLTEGIMTILYVLNPQKLVLGGGIMAQKELLEPKINKMLQAKAESATFLTTEIVFAKLKNNAGMMGALYNFKKRH